MHINHDKNRIVLDDEDKYNNYISIDNYDFEIRYLDKNEPGHSNTLNASIFTLYDPDVGDVTQVIKICRFFMPCKLPWMKLRIDRFKREIKALRKARKEKMNHNVIELITDGELDIDSKKFLYYTMEYADDDLKGFLKQNDLSVQERYLLCAEIIQCIQSLHAIGLYHRDIKPENFLIVNDKDWKIADLGLVAFREDDIAAIDGEREKIGPMGFLSPEALNKWFGVDVQPPIIDDKSDVFQLARVMGLVLQDELFAGQLDVEDFKETYDPDALFCVMSNSFQYRKERRFNIKELNEAFCDKFAKRYAL